MVSPSKIQHQEHKQPSRENKSNKYSHVHAKKELKLLEGKVFYLDIKNHVTTTKIEAKIKDLGGVSYLYVAFVKPLLLPLCFYVCIDLLHSTCFSILIIIPFPQTFFHIYVT